MFRCPPQNCTMSQHFYPAFPETWQNCFYTMYSLSVCGAMCVLCSCVARCVGKTPRRDPSRPREIRNRSARSHRQRRTKEEKRRDRARGCLLRAAGVITQMSTDKQENRKSAHLRRCACCMITQFFRHSTSATSSYEKEGTEWIA